MGIASYSRLPVAGVIGRLERNGVRRTPPPQPDNTACFHRRATRLLPIIDAGLTVEFFCGAPIETGQVVCAQPSGAASELCCLSLLRRQLTDPV